MGRTSKVASAEWVEYRSAVADSYPNPLLHLAAIGATTASHWPTKREFPLLGRNIVVTRDARHASSLVNSLRSLGAYVESCPTIEIAPPDDPSHLEDAVSRLSSYNWVVFTSANGVERLVECLLASGRDVRGFGDARLACIGPATAEALRARGLRVDVIPESYVAESLFEALASAGPMDGARILLARAAVARDVLPDALREAGATVDVIDAYRTIVPAGAAESIRRVVDSPDGVLVTLTSSSTASHFAALAGDSRVSGVEAACIGPITSATARELGFSVVVEATTFTTAGLVEAIVNWATADDGGQSDQSA